MHCTKGVPAISRADRRNEVCIIFLGDSINGSIHKAHGALFSFCFLPNEYSLACAVADRKPGDPSVGYLDLFDFESVAAFSLAILRIIACLDEYKRGCIKFPSDAKECSCPFQRVRSLTFFLIAFAVFSAFNTAVPTPYPFKFRRSDSDSAVQISFDFFVVCLPISCTESFVEQIHIGSRCLIEKQYNAFVGLFFSSYFDLIFTQSAWSFKCTFHFPNFFQEV